MNLESILEMFLNLGNKLQFISKKEMENEVLKFEIDIIPTIQSLINKYSMDFLTPITITNEKPNFVDIIEALIAVETDLPFYLLGFINYSNQLNYKKYLFIKIYKYLKIINPHCNNDLYFKLFQGYALYGILLYEKSDIINFNNFRNLNIKRMTNNDTIDILRISIELLGSKSFLEFKSKLQKVTIEKELEAPKINDIFDNTEDYYKDLYSKLKYFLSQYQTGHKTCEIINMDIYRVL